jgi:KDO2-lipid IV(A) lauroyltransferase
MSQHRPRSRLLDYAVYLTVRLLVCFIQSLSWETALGLARGLARLVYRLDRRHREIAAENVAQAFPELSPEAREDLVRRSFEHLASMAVEMFLAPRIMTAENHRTYISCDDDDLKRLQGYWKAAPPMVVVTGHFGNWEVLNYLCAMIGFQTKVIARRLDNPYLDRFLASFRKQTGAEILDKDGDYDRITGTLATGGILGMVGDQDAGRKGLFVEFFGRPASTFKSIALLTLEYDATLFVVGAARVGTPFQYHIYVEDIIEAAEYADDPDAPRKITERYTAGLERMVRRHPEQYFWVHRRWKSYVKYKLKKAA